MMSITAFAVILGVASPIEASFIGLGLHENCPLSIEIVHYGFAVILGFGSA